MSILCVGIDLAKNVLRCMVWTSTARRFWFVRDGIDAWQAAGRVLEAKGDGS